MLSRETPGWSLLACLNNTGQNGGQPTVNIAYVSCGQEDSNPQPFDP